MRFKSRIIYDTRERLAKLFGAENPKQIVFTMNSTESLNIAIKGLIEPGDHVITTMLEHNSVLRPLYEMEERGAKLTIIKADKQGNFSLEDMEAAITPKTKAIVCTNGSNLTGNYVDVAAVGVPSALAMRSRASRWKGAKKQPLKKRLLSKRQPRHRLRMKARSWRAR